MSSYSDQNRFKNTDILIADSYMEVIEEKAYIKIIYFNILILICQIKINVFFHFAEISFNQRKNLIGSEIYFEIMKGVGPRSESLSELLFRLADQSPLFCLDSL